MKKLFLIVVLVAIYAAATQVTFSQTSTTTVPGSFSNNAIPAGGKYVGNGIHTKAIYLSPTVWLVSNDKIHWKRVNDVETSNTTYKVQLYEKDLLNTVMHLVSVDGGYTWYDSEYFSMINTGPYPETRWIDYSPYGNEVLFTWIFYFN